MQETKAGAMACRMDCSFNNHVGIGSRLQHLFGEALMIIDSCCSDVGVKVSRGDGISGSPARGKCRTSTLSMQAFPNAFNLLLEEGCKLVSQSIQRMAYQGSSSRRGCSQT